MNKTLSPETFVNLFFFSMPKDIELRIQADIENLSRTYPEAVKLLAPIKEFCLHMEKQSESKVFELAVELGLGPYLSQPGVWSLRVGFPATKANIVEIKDILSLVEAGFQVLLARPMEYLEYMAKQVFGTNQEAINRFLTMPSLKTFDGYKPIEMFTFNADPEEMRKKSIAKLLYPLRRGDMREVWAMRYIAKFQITRELDRADDWLKGLFAAIVFAGITNPNDPESVWLDLCKELQPNTFAFFDDLGRLSHKEQTQQLRKIIGNIFN